MKNWQKPDFDFNIFCIFIAYVAIFLLSKSNNSHLPAGFFVEEFLQYTYDISKKNNLPTFAYIQFERNQDDESEEI